MWPPSFRSNCCVLASCPRMAACASTPSSSWKWAAHRTRFPFFTLHLKFARHPFCSIRFCPDQNPRFHVHPFVTTSCNELDVVFHLFPHLDMSHYLSFFTFSKRHVHFSFVSENSERQHCSSHNFLSAKNSHLLMRSWHSRVAGTEPYYPSWSRHSCVIPHITAECFHGAPVNEPAIATFPVQYCVYLPPSLILV